jgi:hypothetical protein
MVAADLGGDDPAMTRLRRTAAWFVVSLLVLMLVVTLLVDGVA